MVNTLLQTDGKDSTSSTAGTSTASYLIPRKLYGRIFRAVRRKIFLSPLAVLRIGPSSIPGSSIDIPRELGTIYIQQWAEGAQIGLDVESFDNFNVKPLKYGVRIGVTKEAEEDSIFPLMALNVDWAGYEFAKNEDTLIVAQLDAASTAASNDVANSNASLPISDITEAMQKLWENEYVPSHIICGTEVASDIMNIDTFVEKDKASITDPSKKIIGQIFGMKVMVTTAVSAKLAYIIDADYAFLIAEKRPITIERYFDAARDTSFAVVTQRIAMRYLRAEAVSEITTT